MTKERLQYLKTRTKYIAERTAQLAIQPPEDPNHPIVEIRLDPPFRYTSGLLSPIYTDNRIYQSLVQSRNEIVNLLKERILIEEEIRQKKFDGFAAVAQAGIWICTLVADRLDRPMVSVRDKAKEHGPGGVIDGQIRVGGYYAIIEDHTSTGGSSIRTKKHLEEKGAIADHSFSITTYMLPEANKKFYEAKLISTSLTDFHHLLLQAIKLGKVAECQREIIENWQRDPLNWAKISY